MAEQTGRFKWIVKLSRITLIGSLVFLSLLLVASVAMVVLTVLKAEHWTTLIPWALAIVLEITAVGWVFVLYGLIKVPIINEWSIRKAVGQLERVESLQEDQGKSLKRLIELGSISDRAKGLIFHENEIEALHEKINHNLIRQDYKGAGELIDAIEKDFGYVAEAAEMREEMEASRKATMEEKIDAAVQRIQKIIDRCDWARATRESQRLSETFPNNPKIAALPERVQNAHAKHKRDLLQTYGEAVKRNEVDHSIELLKELDLYLSPQEAAALEESARGIFRAKLHNLGVQFSIFVTEQQWDKAFVAGEQIVREFPNSRMAQEVSAKMDLLRTRATAETPGN